MGQLGVVSLGFDKKPLRCGLAVLEKTSCFTISNLWALPVLPRSQIFSAEPRSHICPEIMTCRRLRPTADIIFQFELAALRQVDSAPLDYRKSLKNAQTR